MEVREAKRAARSAMRAMLAEIPAGAWEARSARVVERLAGLAEVSGAGVVMIYLGSQKELVVDELGAMVLARGGRVVAPRVDWEGGGMRAVAWRPGEEEVRRHGVREPLEGAEVEVERVEVVVVPGLAFDSGGGRLGRGGGFYDRFLGRPGLRASVVGVALDEQVLGVVPRESGDVGVRAVVTPTRTIRCSVKDGGG